MIKPLQSIETFTKIMGNKQGQPEEASRFPVDVQEGEVVKDSPLVGSKAEFDLKSEQDEIPGERQQENVRDKTSSTAKEQVRKTVVAQRFLGMKKKSAILPDELSDEREEEEQRDSLSLEMKPEVIRTTTQDFAPEKEAGEQSPETKQEATNAEKVALSYFDQILQGKEANVMSSLLVEFFMDQCEGDSKKAKEKIDELDDSVSNLGTIVLKSLMTKFGTSETSVDVGKAEEYLKINDKPYKLHTVDTGSDKLAFVKQLLNLN